MIMPCKADQGEGLLRGETPTTALTEGRTGSTHRFSRLPSSAAPTLHAGLPGHPQHKHNPGWWAAELVKGSGKHLGVAKGKV